MIQSPRRCGAILEEEGEVPEHHARGGYRAGPDHPVGHSSLQGRQGDDGAGAVDGQPDDRVRRADMTARDEQQRHSDQPVDVAHPDVRFPLMRPDDARGAWAGAPCRPSPYSTRLLRSVTSGRTAPLCNESKLKRSLYIPDRLKALEKSPQGRLEPPAAGQSSNPGTPSSRCTPNELSPIASMLYCPTVKTMSIICCVS